MNILGVDPMPGIADKATKNGIPTLSNFFDENFSLELRNKYGPAEIITSNGFVAKKIDCFWRFFLGARFLMVFARFRRV